MRVKKNIFVNRLMASHESKKIKIEYEKGDGRNSNDISILLIWLRIDLKRMNKIHVAESQQDFDEEKERTLPLSLVGKTGVRNN